jgi:Natural resistance-associated macrophage protein
MTQADQSISKKPRNMLLRLLGPGLVTGAADDDPSGIATYSQAGAQFGYGLLWTVFLTAPFMIAIQLVSAQIGRVTGRGLDTIDQCCPETQALVNAQDDVESAGVFRANDWHETTFSETSFRPPLIRPRHLRDAPAGAASLVEGAWALDLDIERTANHSRFANVQHRWRLPRRLRMSGAFSRAYQLGGSHGALCFLRVTKDGLLTVFGTVEGRLPEINAPTDEIAFRVALCVPRDWMPSAPGSGPYQNSLVFDMRPSDKGRYLTALTHLSGGIHQGRAIFLKKFWKQQFEFLGASPSAGDERLPELVQRLQNRLRSGAIATQEDWQKIARVVLTEARAVRLPPRYVRFDRLERQFEEFRNAFWAEHQPGTPREQWDEEEKESLGESVRYLCQREILHQGHEWLCRRCNNNNWVGIDALRKSMTCEVCGTEEPAPVASPWHFRLNSFVLDGLRAHGQLAYLWCLSRLSDQAQACFFYLEPHELFFTTNSADARRPDAEIDLIVVVDGLVRLCEVKTSNQNIDLRKLSDLARRLRPDIATLAVMEPRSPSTDRRLEDLRHLLDGSGVEAEIMTLQQDDIDDSPYLPEGRSQMVRLG